MNCLLWVFNRALASIPDEGSKKKGGSSPDTSRGLSVCICITHRVLLQIKSYEEQRKHTQIFTKYALWHYMWHYGSCLFITEQTTDKRNKVCKMLTFKNQIIFSFKHCLYFVSFCQWISLHLFPLNINNRNLVLKSMATVTIVWCDKTLIRPSKI